MTQEFQAWQEVVKHWPGNINETHTKLVFAIQLWGECLAQLRDAQDAEYHKDRNRTHENIYLFSIARARAEYDAAMEAHEVVKAQAAQIRDLVSANVELSRQLGALAEQVKAAGLIVPPNVEAVLKQD